ncbi:MAG: DUF294 nucleotidyltransferase-like domain-containing protein [Pigmentiphaga sp.]|nr:DUF294 nucleotidyltransferase-like domain-containing protein [Pigmentiphaga sp.]
MQVELLEIRDHLARHAPFDALPSEVLDDLVTRVEIAYYKAGSEIFAAGEPLGYLSYVRSGAVELYRRNGALYNRLTEGDIFGQSSLLRGGKVRLPARAFEDSLIYFITADDFQRLCDEHENFADFVEAEGQPRLKTVIEDQGKANELLRLRVGQLVSRPPVWAPPTASIREAAAIMSEQGVSSLLIMEPGEPWPEAGGEPGAAIDKITGIITDRDLRTRVLAVDLPPETPVREIMTPRPVAMQVDDSVFQASLTMLRHKVHHLPVLYRRRAVGVINLADIMRFESRSSLYLVNGIFHRNSVDELRALVPDMRATFVRLVADQATAEMVGRAMSSIGRAYCQRLCELAEEQLGPPPVPYCFMVAGSMARDEQLLISDQDNALVIGDAFDPALHDAYFAALAKFVSDGLAACGYTYCKGDIMATNPRWRQPLRVWRDTFLQWITQPNPEALLHSSVFFDLEGVYGDSSMVDKLRDLIATRAGQDPTFLGAMTRNALNRTPPLGLFRTFVMEKDGEQRNIINLKGRGTAPLIDLIRIHALACGTIAQHSLERLDAIAARRWLPPEAIEHLRYAFEFLSWVRVRHQAYDVEEGREPGNYIRPERFSASERHNLKDAFQILSDAQNFLRLRYPMQPPARGRA